MSKELTPLEALKVIKESSVCGIVSLGTIFEKELDLIETALKALEIIKKKRCLGKFVANEETKYCIYARLTQEEYDLLKEKLL